jgi:hypothetical protein
VKSNIVGRLVATLTLLGEMNISLVSGVGIDDEDDFAKCRQDLRLGIKALRVRRNLIIFESEKVRTLDIDILKLTLLYSELK